MKITYLDNSGFAVEINNDLLIFDYYNNRSETGKTFADGVIDFDALEGYDNIYCFVSHEHPDHFTRAIFRIARRNPNTHYIIDRKIKPAEGVDSTRMAPSSFYEDGKIYVMAFGDSYDVVSYVVQIHGKTLFHAGDLHCWHWMMESDESESKKAREAYTKELTTIRKYLNDRPDVAFLVLDPRLTQGIDDGLLEFNAMFKPKYIVPMHMQGEYWLSKPLSRKIKCPVWCYDHRGQSIEI